MFITKRLSQQGDFQRDPENRKYKKDKKKRKTVRSHKNAHTKKLNDRKELFKRL